MLRVVLDTNQFVSSVLVRQGLPAQLMEVKSGAWTLTYRELRALKSLETEPDQLPELDAPDLE